MPEQAGEPMNERAKTIARIQQLVERVSEHCTSIRVVAVIPGEDGDCIYSCGDGDFYSQRGAVREWMLREDQKSRLEVERENE